MFKYLLPIALVAVWSAWAQKDGDTADLETSELFLRPVVVKYGQDHPGLYTWQGGSGVGPGWGTYKSKGWGWGEMKKKKKGKKKKKKKKKKKPKKKKKKKSKKKKKDKGGWGWSLDDSFEDDDRARIIMGNLADGMTRYGEPMGGYVVPEYVYDGHYDDHYYVDY